MEEKPKKESDKLSKKDKEVYKEIQRLTGSIQWEEFCLKHPINPRTAVLASVCCTPEPNEEEVQRLIVKSNADTLKRNQDKIEACRKDINSLLEQ